VPARLQRAAAMDCNETPVSHEWLCLTTKAQRPGLRDVLIATTARWPVRCSAWSGCVDCELLYLKMSGVQAPAHRCACRMYP
jgi:hypothetical protein